MRPLIAAVLLAGVATGGIAASSRRTPVVEVVERVRPAVVNLTARQVVAAPRRWTLFEQLFPELGPPDPRVYRSQSLGSGVLVSPDGLVVTNEHVIAGAAEITVRFADGREEAAQVIGSDTDADIAVLRVGGRNLPHLPLQDRDDILIGETVIAIGNPLGLENTVTVGVLSARDRTVTSPSTRRVYTDFLQTDASINPGNSGGALVDLDGRLMGVNTAIFGDAQGIGFAIPARRVRRVVNDLLRFGQVQPAWLGTFVRSRGEGPRGARLGHQGIEIADVLPGSPGDRAGLRPGMVLVTGNGRPLATRDDYATLLAQTSPGEQVVLEVAEETGRSTVRVRAERAPEGIGEQVLARFVGIQIAERGQGLIVTRVTPGSAAEEAGLRAGDTLLSLNGQRVRDIGEINRLLTRDHTRSSLLLMVGRGRFAYNLTFPLAS